MKIKQMTTGLLLAAMLTAGATTAFAQSEGTGNPLEKLHNSVTIQLQKLEDGKQAALPEGTVYMTKVEFPASELSAAFPLVAVDVDPTYEGAVALPSFEGDVALLATAISLLDENSAEHPQGTVLMTKVFDGEGAIATLPAAVVVNSDKTTIPASAILMAKLVEAEKAE